MHRDRSVVVTVSYTQAGALAVNYYGDSELRGSATISSGVYTGQGALIIIFS